MALARNIQRQLTVHDPQLVPLAVAAATTIYEGALTATNASGLAIPGADSAGITFMGIAWRGYDNSGGSAGTMGGTAFNAFDAVRYCEVDVEGEWEIKFTGTTPKPGQLAFVVDDDTVSAAATTNNIPCGRFTKPGTPGYWFVDIERR